VLAIDLKKILREVTDAVAEAMRTDRIVNVSMIAEAVRSRNDAVNMAREDIEALVMEAAQLRAAPMEFGLTDRLSALDAPPGCILEIIPVTSGSMSN